MGSKYGREVNIRMYRAKFRLQVLVHHAPSPPPSPTPLIPVSDQLSQSCAR